MHGTVEQHGDILAPLPMGMQVFGDVVGHDVAMHSADMLVIYTDGACSGNPGPGGWAWAVAPDGEPRGSGGERSTTNQRMELTAVIEAIRTNLPIAHAEVKRLVIVSDSTYVVNCFRDRWWVRWLNNGWRNAKKEPVANADLWEPLIEMYVSLSENERPDFQWVKGHNGDPMNDLVDRLAVAAVPSIPS